MKGIPELKNTRKIVHSSLKFIQEKCSNNGAFDALSLDDHQYAVYTLALSFSELEAAKSFAEYAKSSSDFEKCLASCFIAEVVHSINTRLLSSPKDFGAGDWSLATTSFVSEQLSSDNLSKIGKEIIAKNGHIEAMDLTDNQKLIKRTFGQFADEVVAPIAQDIHRFNMSIPEKVLKEVGGLGCFGLSIPQRYGGLLRDDNEDSLGMILVTEELSRVSLGGAGSLITRPEIVARALLMGGTEQQKRYWLPKIASGEKLCAIAITEPDYGSDVASVQLKATPVSKGWILNGSKTWSTFAGRAHVLLTLARTESDKSLGHKGLSLFIVEKPSFIDEDFEVKQSSGGCLSGKAIPTVGYRGMHSYQLFFDDFFIPETNIIGEKEGAGKGFYFTMRGFTGGRIQTAARACGLIQASLNKAIQYTKSREVFSKPVADYQLTQVKLARIAIYLFAARRFTYAVGRLLDKGEGQMEASLVKLFTCRASEWITRDAMQMHGGMGYAEENDMSRYWLDARVLSIFEGTEETLALKVIGRSLIERAGSI